MRLVFSVSEAPRSPSGAAPASIGRLVVCVLSMCLGSGASMGVRVEAQALPTASVLQTSRSEGVDEGVGGAFDRMLRQRLDGLEVVEVSGAVVLDLEQVQIALGCMGETVQCLDAVAGEIGAQILLVPSIDRVGDSYSAALLLFDARDDSQRRATRQATGASAQTDLLQQVEPMVRELFDLPPATTVGDGHVAPPAGPGLSPFPFVLIGSGVAAIVVGAVLGSMSQDDAAAYRATPIPVPATTQEIDAALGLRSRAETEAIVANVMFVAGGLLVAGGVAWLLAAGNEDGSSPIAFAPVIGPGTAGIALAGRFEGPN